MSVNFQSHSDLLGEESTECSYNRPLESKSDRQPVLGVKERVM